MQKLKRSPLSQRVDYMLNNLSRLGESLLNKLSPSPNTLTTAALIVLLVLIFLTIFGCTPNPVRPTLPPQADARPVPEFTGQTYRDVILYVIELRESALASEADKAAIRYVFRSEK